MNKEIILNIQKQFLSSANKRLSKTYINNNILPIIEYIAFSKKNKFLIGGSQGIGKSTLVNILKKILQIFYKKKVLVLCLDDYYLTKKERVFLSKNVHPLLITRGVPGTHDIDKLINDIKKFNNSKFPILIPIFDKLIDDRSSRIKKEISKADILILEGWCCGASDIKSSYLLKNINKLEKNRDKNTIWRKYYNSKLKNEYRKLFNIFDKTIFLKAPSFKYILNWRIKQEKMNKSNAKIHKKMNKKNLINFIEHYEKITKYMLKELPNQANMVIKVDKKQNITSFSIK